jgi:hypothetical protein
MPKLTGTTKQTVQTSLRITPLAMELWGKLADREGVNRPAYLEVALRRLAREAGILNGDDGQESGQ